MAIRIACAADRDFVPHCAAMLHSVLAHAGGEQVAIDYLHDPELPRRSRRLLRQMVEQAGADIEFHEISERMVEGLPVTAQFPAATWYRLFVPGLVEADRVVFLDADVIVLDDLRPLASIDLGTAYVAGVEDRFALFTDRRTLLGIEGEQGYFNAGVVVFNVGAVREDGLDRALVAEARRLAPWLFARDQDALNVVLGHRRLPLHPRWNLTDGIRHSPTVEPLFDPAVLREARERPAIRHFTGRAKPWAEDRPDDADLYWRHREASPF